MKQRSVQWTYPHFREIPSHESYGQTELNSSFLKKEVKCDDRVGADWQIKHLEAKILQRFEMQVIQAEIR